ncbi:ATP-binding protein [Desulfofundulus sp.]|uniref:ATP-binding protein n=1 Tax=Desulfofundulus sp. TaxID=2282750 RepID=UPI003C75E0E6
MSITFRKAERKQAKLRLALAGPAGSGKTYSALLIAFGLGGRIAVLDTERSSAELYSHLGDYDVCCLETPFTPQKYIDAIRAAESAGYDVIIIDSLSHAWAGPGGVLEIHDAVAAKEKNSWAAWRHVTPLHNELVDTILQSKCHIIATMRSKTEYVQVQDGGKARVQKVGMAPVQRDGMEYEFTVFLDLDLTHTAVATKDRTSMFDGITFRPSVDTGKKLLAWLKSGTPEKTTQPSGKKPGMQESSGQKESGRDSSGDGGNDSKTRTFRLVKAEKGNHNGKPLVRVALQDENNQVVTAWAANGEVGIADISPGTVLEVVLEEKGKGVVVTGFRVVEDARGEVA